MSRPTCSLFKQDRAFARGGNRRALTLVELLMTMAISAVVMLGFVAITSSITTMDTISRSRSETLQHGQVAALRIQDHIRQAYVNDSFPGFRVYDTTVGSYRYPDVLIVWRPSNAPTNPNGKPTVGELVVIGPDPSNPNQLVELRQSSTTTCPDYTDTTAWTATLITMLQSGQKTVISDRLRTAHPAGATGTTRGCVRFNRLAAPTDTALANYRASSVSWDTLNWPLDLFSSKAGMRTVACQFELQFSINTQNTTEILPIFGSASRSYEVLP
jgi:prepilin-type N-terminal cleavage/methylation domain-containing protein